MKAVNRTFVLDRKSCRARSGRAFAHALLRGPLVEELQRLLAVDRATVQAKLQEVLAFARARFRRAPVVIEQA